MMYQTPIHSPVTMTFEPIMNFCESLHHTVHPKVSFHPHFVNDKSTLAFITCQHKVKQCINTTRRLDKKT
jgi:hypothetical protein